MIAATRRVLYVNEPLNPNHPPGRSPGVLDVRVEHRFQYVTDANGDAYSEAYRHLLALHYRLGLELRTNHTPHDVARAGYSAMRFMHGRVMSRRPLIADPFAVLSVRWFARRLGCRVVVVVRRPEAVVSSRRRLGWSFDPRELRSQPLLDAEILGALAQEHPGLFEGREGMIDQGSQLWAILHLAVDRLRRQVPEIVVVRHEDLSRDPVGGFRELVAALALPFDPCTERAIRRATSGGNPAQVDVRDPHRTRVDSLANLEHWKTRLSNAEIVRIRDLTATATDAFYPDLPELAAPRPSAAR
jgi:hypothetical protein